MISWTVTNTGGVPAPADWQDRVYISDDDVFDGSDEFVVSQFDHVADAAGRRRIVHGARSVARCPTRPPADRFLLFITDSGK